jgi:hypothetical protein
LHASCSVADAVPFAVSLQADGTSVLSTDSANERPASYVALTGSVGDIGDGSSGSWVGQVAGTLDPTDALALHMTAPGAGFASSAWLDWAVGQGQSAASCAELESNGSLELSYGEEVSTEGCSHLVYILVGCNLRYY